MVPSHQTGGKPRCLGKEKKQNFLCELCSSLHFAHVGIVVLKCHKSESSSIVCMHCIAHCSIKTLFLRPPAPKSKPKPKPSGQQQGRLHTSSHKGLFWFCLEAKQNCVYGPASFCRKKKTFEKDCITCFHRICLAVNSFHWNYFPPNK